MSSFEKPASAGGCPIRRTAADDTSFGDAAIEGDHARFEALLHAAVDAVIVIDAAGRIERFSPAAETMFGYRESEILGANVSQLMPEPYRSQHDDYLKHYLETGEARIIGIGREVIGQRADGTVFPMDLAVGHVRLGTADQFVGFARNISERQRLHAEADALRERLAHVGRLGLLGEMAAGIAHEVNQPLAAIANYAQACRYGLEGGTADIDEVLVMLEKITRGTQRAGAVIRRLRAMASQRESEHDVVALDTLVEEVIRLAELDARLHNAHLDLTLGVPGVTVLVDGIQIQQVVLNLARNGIEAMTTDNGMAQHLAITTHRDREEVVVSIRDHGVGLRAQAAEQIFHPFFTTKAEGMGMGLSICSSIVEAHGGRLWFTPNEDRGTTFHFSLPIHEDAARKPQDSVSEATAHDGGFD